MATLLLFILSLALQDAPNEAGFLDRLEAIERRTARGDWKGSYRALQTLLEDHAEARYVFTYQAEVEHALERSLAGRAGDGAELEDLTSGRLLSYEERSGKIHIRYEGGALRDFEFLNGVLIHPASFTGPHSMEVRGERYPAGRPPWLVLCADEDSALQVSFGGSRRLAVIVAVGDESPRTLDTEISQVDIGKPFKLRVKVGGSTIQTYYNGKRIFNVKRPPGDYGRVGIGGLPSDQIGSVELKGKIETSWLENLRDMQTQMESMADIDLADHLPPWLKPLDRSFEEEDEADGEEPVYPGPRVEQLDPAWNWVADIEEAQLIRAGIRNLLGLPEGRLPQVQLDYLLAKLYRADGQLEEALARSSSVAEADPYFLPTRMWEGELLMKLGRWEEAGPKVRYAFMDFPQSRGAAVLYLQLLLAQGRADEAAEIFLEASRTPERARLLGPIRRVLVRVEKGPPWPRTFEHVGKHYVVRSDISRRVCSDAAARLDKAYQAYTLHIERPASDAKKKHPVYLFSGQAGFLRYSAEALGALEPGAAGLYSPTLKQLLIWNLPEEEAMQRTILHEGFHQYLDELVTDAPIWLNEGLAEYYELAGYENGAWQVGQIHRGHIDHLLDEDSELLPLEELLHLTHQAFRHDEDQLLLYAQSWALVHFLQHSSRDHRARFELLFDQLVSGTSARDAIDAAFAGFDLERMDESFREYLRELR